MFNLLRSKIDFSNSWQPITCIFCGYVIRFVSSRELYSGAYAIHIKHIFFRILFSVLTCFPSSNGVYLPRKICFIKKIDYVFNVAILPHISRWYWRTVLFVSFVVVLRAALKLIELIFEALNGGRAGQIGELEKPDCYSRCTFNVCVRIYIYIYMCYGKS